MIEQYVPISQMEEGEKYDQIFMLKSVKPIVNNKKSFVRFEVQDVTGTLPGVVWDMKLKGHDSAMSPGKFVRMVAFLREYKGEITISANRNEVQPFNGEPDNITDYVPGPNDAVLDVYAKEVSESIDRIEDPHIRDLISNAESRVDLISIMRGAPYMMDGPLSHRGGLLMFVADMLRIAECTISSSRRIVDPDDFNSSLVIAGCLLRHIGWSTCTQFFGRVLKPNNAFYMTGIERASFRFINHLCLHAESDLSIELPLGKKQALENMCQTDITRINTMEGRVVEMASRTAFVLHMGQFWASQRNNGSGWSPGGELFLEHLRNE